MAHLSGMRGMDTITRTSSRDRDLGMLVKNACLLLFSVTYARVNNIQNKQDNSQSEIPATKCVL